MWTTCKKKNSGGTTERIQSFMIIPSALTLVEQPKYFSSCQPNEDGVMQSKIFVDGHNVRNADIPDLTSVHHPVSCASRNIQDNLGRHRSVSQSKTKKHISL